jgi:hypothetical protein
MNYILKFLYERLPVWVWILFMEVVDGGKWSARAWLLGVFASVVTFNLQMAFRFLLDEKPLKELRDEIDRLKRELDELRSMVESS